MHINYPVSVVIPAFNEEKTIANVIQTFLNVDVVKEIIVVNNASTDKTKKVAESAGAFVIDEPRRGYGRAVKTGLLAAKHDLVLKCDADLKNPNQDWINELLMGYSPGIAWVRGIWESKQDPLRITKLMARPAIRKLFPHLLDVELPLTGQYLIVKSFFDIERLSDDFSFELDLLIRSKASELNLSQVYIGVLEHADRSLDRDSEMCFQLLSYLINASRLRLDQRILIVMAHSDDPVIWSGGLLSKYLSVGASVDIIVFCSDSERMKEFDTLKKYFPFVHLESYSLDEFDCWPKRDICMRLSKKFQDRQFSIVVTHHINDPHSDHAEVAQIVRNAVMDAGSQCFPKKILMCTPYFHQTGNIPGFDPDIFLNISDEAKLKAELIREHVSQTPEYWVDMVSVMDRLMGIRSCVDKAEAYESMRFYRTPAAVNAI